MSSYTKSTDFASKDALITGNPLKVVKGTEIDDEFNAIQTAVNSKADANSPTLTGTPLAPTATTGTNTTQIATTAFVEATKTAILASVYPVGSVYTNASNATNPATLLGFGTWEAIGAGRVLINQDASNSIMDTLGETGGTADSVVVSHTHSITDPGHFHTYTNGNSYTGSPTSATGGSGSVSPTTFNGNSATTGISINSAGESGTNKNLQPYVVVKMWKRTA